jgi:hypothetical protein
VGSRVSACARLRRSTIDVKASPAVAADGDDQADLDPPALQPPGTSLVKSAGMFASGRPASSSRSPRRRALACASISSSQALTVRQVGGTQPSWANRCRSPPFGIMSGADHGTLMSIGSDAVGAAKEPMPHSRLSGDRARRRPDGLVFQLRPADGVRDHQQVNQRPRDRHAGANKERQHE